MKKQEVEIQINKSKLVPTSKIKPYWNNPREENEAAAQAVAESIRLYGFNQPIVVDTDFVIVVGHKRFRAAQVLGLTKVPVIELDLPEDKLKEYRIADNSINDLTKFDFSKLEQELRTLPGLDTLEGFMPFDIKGLIADTKGVGLPDVTMADFNKAEQVMHEPIEKTQGPKIRLYCPGCGEEIEIDKP